MKKTERKIFECMNASATGIRRSKVRKLMRRLCTQQTENTTTESASEKKDERKPTEQQSAPLLTASSSQTEVLINHLRQRYELRFNTLMGYAEWRMKGDTQGQWTAVDELQLNSMAIDAQLAGIGVAPSTIMRYLRSNKICVYNPIAVFIDSLRGQWDGTDHIGRLAQRIAPDETQWTVWFRRWMLAMVAQWMGINAKYGNAVAPLLISPQGYGKSTFCRSLIPPQLAWGYTDNLMLNEKRQVMLAMNQMLLINLDEFNQHSAAVQQGFLKNIMQLPTVKVKRPYGKLMEELPRMASFIATTNMGDVLTDPSGSRRFIAIEIRKPIDLTTPIDHRQLYAQAVSLIEGGERYWFNAEETEQIKQHNQRYQTRSVAEQFFNELFDTAENEEEGCYMTAASIFAQIKRAAGNSLYLGSLLTFGRRLTNMEHLQQRHSRRGTEYLVRRR